MTVGIVTGNVWATKKCTGLNGQILLAVTAQDRTVIAVDLVGAGEGDTVLVSTGNAARLSSPNLPADAAIVAILDQQEVGHVNQ